MNSIAYVMVGTNDIVKASTFYEKDVAASTTATGRKLLIYAKAVIERAYDNTIEQTNWYPNGWVSETLINKWCNQTNWTPYKYARQLQIKYFSALEVLVKINFTSVITSSSFSTGGSSYM